MGSNQPYVKEFTKECNVVFIYGTFVLEVKADLFFKWGITFIADCSRPFI